MTQAIFLTHPHAIRSEITGGVQLCSQEFFHVISGIREMQLDSYFVPYTKHLFRRAQIKAGLENYSSFNIQRDKKALFEYIRAHKTEIVFINMSSLVRYAKPIKQEFGDRVKIVLLSHGNHSGDFLHLISKPIREKMFLGKWLDRIRLGNLIATESEYRVKWLDGVVALSETEKQIENWFGARKVSFLPRRLYSDFLDLQNKTGRIGFVGRLDHPPNLQGLSLLLEEFNRKGHVPEFRLVGAPTKNGTDIQKQFPFVQYLGELSDRDLENELKTWAFFTNPVWWYSTGSSTKLARAISWGLPIITSTAGMRGYEWKSGSLLVADSPAEMVGSLIKEAYDPQRIDFWKEQTRLIARNGLGDEDLAARIRYTYL
jgi:hypothetical protein